MNFLETKVVNADFVVMMDKDKKTNFYLSFDPDGSFTNKKSKSSFLN